MIRFQAVSYRYPGQDEPALENFSWEVSEGTVALVAGPSGCGKSTILRCPNGLIPHFYGGRFGGCVLTFGHDTRCHGTAALSRLTGFVAQEPETQTVTDRVEDEIAFGPENAGLPRREILQRVDELLLALGIGHLRDRELSTLSGGERQRVVIAAACALRPRLLALDEPTSQIDPWSAPDVVDAFTRLNGDFGTTILLAEHRLARVLPVAERVLVLGCRGQVVADGSPIGVAGALDEPSSLPRPAATATVEQAALELEGVSYRYGQHPALSEVSLAFAAGQVTALMGRNGSGKTTLLKLLNGLLRPEQGRVRLFGADIARRATRDLARQVAYLPQHPGALLFNETVAAELRFTLRCRRAAGDIERTLVRLGLSALSGRHPFDLSGGERQRAALAAVLIGDPPVVALDEPTRGMDARRKAELARMLGQLAHEGAAVVLATHDIDLVRGCAHQVVLLEQGRVAARGSIDAVLAADPLLAA
ncbi:MAG TPA: ATP-binding cassette domain-containing protein [Thermomicrobiaceae bacterium]|nr:ATP-binding cassette domain-containing protein [Thermomicrobiaceae bacterium]